MNIKKSILIFAMTFLTHNNATGSTDYTCVLNSSAQLHFQFQTPVSYSYTDRKNTYWRSELTVEQQSPPIDLLSSDKPENPSLRDELFHMIIANLALTTWYTGTNEQPDGTGGSFCFSDGVTETVVSSRKVAWCSLHAGIQSVTHLITGNSREAVVTYRVVRMVRPVNALISPPGDGPFLRVYKYDIVNKDMIIRLTHDGIPVSSSRSGTTPLGSVNCIMNSSPVLTIRSSSVTFSPTYAGQTASSELLWDVKDNDGNIPVIMSLTADTGGNSDLMLNGRSVLIRDEKGTLLSLNTNYPLTANSGKLLFELRDNGGPYGPATVNLTIAITYS